MASWLYPYCPSNRYTVMASSCPRAKSPPTTTVSFHQKVVLSKQNIWMTMWCPHFWWCWQCPLHTLTINAFFVYFFFLPFFMKLVIFPLSKSCLWPKKSLYPKRYVEVVSFCLSFLSWVSNSSSTWRWWRSDIGFIIEYY